MIICSRPLLPNFKDTWVANKSESSSSSRVISRDFLLLRGLFACSNSIACLVTVFPVSRTDKRFYTNFDLRQLNLVAESTVNKAACMAHINIACHQHGFAPDAPSLISARDSTDARTPYRDCAACSCKPREVSYQTMNAPAFPWIQIFTLIFFRSCHCCRG